MELSSLDPKEKKSPYTQTGEKSISMFTLPDLSSPPPAIPPGYGSSLYPGENLDLNSPPEKQLEEISIKRKSAEFSTFVKSKVKNYRDIRMKNFHLGKKYCSICSEYSSSVFPQNKVIFHNHNSSKSSRMSSAPRKWGVYPCSTCKIQLHSFKTGIRHPVLVTSSLLNNWQGDRSVNKYPGDDIHVDMIGIPGGTVKILHHAFMAEFGSCSSPVDVLVVGAVNDVMRGKNATKIIRDLKKFKNDVLSMKTRTGAGGRSTFSVATPPFPPKVAVLPYEERVLQDNRFEILSSLTTMIRELNRSDPRYKSFKAPTFHTWGLKTKKLDPAFYGPRNLMEICTKYRDPQWREKIYTEMVHLNDSSRLRMGKAVLTFFKVLYGIVESKDIPKVLALEIEKNERESRKRKHYDR